MGCRQIVEPGPHFPPRAVGTPRTVRSAVNTALVPVAQPAAPPDLLHAAWSDLLRHQLPVALPVPLCRQIGAEGRQVRLSGDRLFARAVGTAAALNQRRRHDLPLVAPLTLPPIPLVGVGHDLRRLGFAVFGRVPPAGHFGVSGDKVGLVGDHLLAGTVGAAPPQRDPGHGAGLPAVAAFAVPPDLFFASGADLLRGQRQVPAPVPLGEQLRSSAVVDVFS